MRGKLASCTGTRIRPKWSITIEARTCPVRISPIVVAAPRRGVRIIGGEDEQGAEQTSRPRPPRRAGDRARQRRLHHQRADYEGDRGGGQGPADEGPQAAFDAELHGQDDSGRERDRQQDPGHPHYYRGS